MEATSVYGDNLVYALHEDGSLGRGSRDCRAYDHVRKSIFGGVAVCAKCGYALCSCFCVFRRIRPGGFPHHLWP